MTESEQAQAIFDGAMAVANERSMAGDHIGAAQVVGLLQLARALRTQLAQLSAPPPEGEAP